MVQTCCNMISWCHLFSWCSLGNTFTQLIIQMNEWMDNELMNEPTYLPTYSPTNQPSYQPTYPLTHRPTYLPTHPPTYLTNLRTSQVTYQPTYLPTHPTIYLPTNLKSSHEIIKINNQFFFLPSSFTSYFKQPWSVPGVMLNFSKITNTSSSIRL